MEHKKSVLVTGIPRSGTTWVGKILAQAPHMRYVHEPFNITKRPCACGIYFDKWFYYLTTENEACYRQHLQHLISASSNQFHLLNMLIDVRSNNNLRPLKIYFQQLRATRTVVKDPLAYFSSCWLSCTFNMQVVILIRHPAAVANSYKQLGWEHDFSHFLSQPLLMRDYLAPFADEIAEFATNKHELIDQIALLWKLVYSAVSQQAAHHDDWLLVRHEDLCRNPENEFASMLYRLNITPSPSLHRAITATTTTNNAQALADPYSIFRNSHVMCTQWKTQLSQWEIAQVHQRVGNLADRYYAEDEW
jgi:hypothetical protein